MLVYLLFSLKLRVKVGLSTADFKRAAVTESNMPTPRAKAAFKYLLANNKYYKKYLEMQKDLLGNDRILTISSFDLFINYTGIECAMYPVLYPETAFTDTGILETYRDESGDTTFRRSRGGTFRGPLPLTASSLRLRYTPADKWACCAGDRNCDPWGRLPTFANLSCKGISPKVTSIPFCSLARVSDDFRFGGEKGPGNGGG